MSARCWQRRRTKQGLAARQLASISRQMRRSKGLPLPQRFESRGTGLRVTVTLEPKRDWPGDYEGFVDGFWDEDDEPYDGELGPDQARWRP